MSERISSSVEQPRGPRSVEEMVAVLEHREKHKLVTVIFDDGGKELCEMDYEEGSGDVLEIRTKPYINTEGGGEHPQEYVNITDEEGNISDEKVTRQEARDRGERYLVVTNLIFHNGDVLLQRRTADKKIDPSLMSSSAHGVAKAVHLENSYRMRNMDYVSLINTALEINEELRHGDGTEQFRVRIWPGSEVELLEWAEGQKIDDGNTIYLIPTALYTDAGYPLQDRAQKRARATSSGFIFSSERPMIVPDPAEVVETEWRKMSSFVDDPNMTQDLQECVNAFVEHALEDPANRGERLSRREAIWELTRMLKG